MRRIALAALLVTAAVLAAPAPSFALERRVMFVVGNASVPTSSEVLVVQRLTGADFEVTVVDDDLVAAADAAANDLVLVGQTISAANATNALRNVAVPVWVAKPYLFDDFGLTGTTPDVDYGLKKATQVTITAPGHPMAAGRAGTVAFQTGHSVSWGKPTASATTVASAGPDAAVFVVEPGDPLATGGAAPACRLTFPLYSSGPAALTADGWAMFDATADWAADNCVDDASDDPPSISLTSPANGSTVRDVVGFTADATGDAGVVGVTFAVDGSTVATDTDGANGWTGSWASTGTPDGPHTITATATDTAGQTATSSITVHVANVVTKRVLMVVANPGARTAGEDVTVQRLTAAGYDVTVADDNTVTAAATAGQAFVLVAQTASAANATDVLRNVAVPLWVAKPYLFDDFGLTGTVPDVDYGLKKATPVTITTPGHPMAAGRTGTVALQTAHSVSWGRPTASATTVAKAGNDAVVFFVAAGAPLSTGQAAPACRLTFPLYTSGPTAFTADGLAMFAATTAWAADNCDGTPPDPVEFDHVIQISVDALNPDAITQLGAAGAPTFHRLLAEGASTLNARSVVERTQTLPNHTSVMTGRPVEGASGHQVGFNEDDGSTLETTAGSYIAGVFDVVHDNGGSTALYADAPKFNLLDRSWNATNGAPDTTGTDNGRDKIDTYLQGEGSVTVPALLDQLATAPKTFNFIHLDETDNAGHQYGFMSTEYIAAVQVVDGLIGQILDAVAADPALAGRTVVIVSSDHGGLGGSHGDATKYANYRIAFFAWGPDVDAGADLYALNADRADPGVSQPPYTAPVPPIRNADSANLVTELLGLGPVPGSVINADQSLDTSA